MSKKRKKKRTPDAIKKNRDTTKQTKLSGFYHAEARS